MVVQVSGTNDLGLYSQASGRVMRFVTNNADIRWYADSGIGTTAIMGLAKNGRLDIKNGTSIFAGWGKAAINFTRSGVISFENNSFSGTSDMGLYSNSTTRDIRHVTNNRSHLWFTNYSHGSASSHCNNWRMKLWNYGNLEVKRDLLTRELFETSDLRLKESIFTLKSSLENVLRLRGVSFEWKNEKHKKKRNWVL